jgi:hypothetical protein
MATVARLIHLGRASANEAYHVLARLACDPDRTAHGVSYDVDIHTASPTGEGDSHRRGWLTTAADCLLGVEDTTTTVWRGDRKVTDLPLLLASTELPCSALDTTGLTRPSLVPRNAVTVASPTHRSVRASLAMLLDGHQAQLQAGTMTVSAYGFGTVVPSASGRLLQRPASTRALLRCPCCPEPDPEADAKTAAGE